MIERETSDVLAAYTQAVVNAAVEEQADDEPLVLLAPPFGPRSTPTSRARGWTRSRGGSEVVASPC